MEVKMNEATPLPTEIITWLKTHSHCLQSLQPADSFNDLQPLKHILGDARIVALGEASHSTREFARLKHRLLAFLVKEMGFTALGLEASWSEVLPLDIALGEGRDHLDRLLRQMRFWPWRTQEMLALLHWMRAENEHRGTAPALRFFGFDMQEIHRAMDHVLMFLRHAAPQQVAAVKSLYEPVYRCIQKRDPFAYGKQSPEVKVLCRANVERAYTLLADVHPLSLTNSLQTSWDAAVNQGIMMAESV
jgi:erythromycin esterase-like protein